ncbi:MAG: serpin family protein [Spartobacteria bacterium]|nr:serpin family protein [Spartobacteria bacterium]
MNRREEFAMRNNRYAFTRGVVALIMGLSMTTAAFSGIPSTLVQGNNAFAFELYRELKSMDGNLFFSPYSISSALAMTYAGARGSTAAEMARTLHFTLGEVATHPAFAQLNARLEAIQAEGHVQLQAAHSLWPQKGYPFLPAYLALIEKYYGSTITPLDYVNETEQARITINTWVEDRTQDKIKNLIAEGALTPLTRMVLVNAIYFKGDWATPFNPEHTAALPFYLPGNTTAQANFMTLKQKFNYAESDDLQVIELPYVGDDLSMLVLLPKNRDGLPAVESALSGEQLDRWTAGLQRREVQVFLPKFKITWGTVSLNKALVALGMGGAFGPKADFTGMDKQNGIFISDVLHKAFVEVNEEGTEAAAATAVVMRMTAMPARPVVFRADHPFLFLIQDTSSRNILFMGRVSNPALLAQ